MTCCAFKHRENGEMNTFEDAAYARAALSTTIVLFRALLKICQSSARCRNGPPCTERGMKVAVPR